MRNISRAFTVLLLIVGIATFSTLPQAGALSNGLGITPRKDYTIAPGQTVTDTLYISNLSLNEGLEVDMRVIDFGAKDETGSPALQLSADAPQTPWSLKPFLKVPASVQVAAGKSVYVPITVTIPASQGAGSYYSAIEYTAVNPETQQRVNIAASSATLMFVTVPGNAKEQLILRQFGAWQAFAADQLTGEFKSWFIGTTPKELAYLLQNEGNVAEAPAGGMIVRNMFGHISLDINNVNPNKELVLLGQTRRIQVCMKSSVVTQNGSTGQPTQQTVCDSPGLLPGRYSVQAALFYGLNGNSNKEIDATASFWYFPWWSIIGFVGLIVVVTALVWLIRRAFNGGSRRRYRR